MRGPGDRYGPVAALAKRVAESGRRKDASFATEADAGGFESLADRLNRSGTGHGFTSFEAENRPAIGARGGGQIIERPIQGRPRHAALDGLQVVAGDAYPPDDLV
jgi:hypothetical protein